MSEQLSTVVEQLIAEHRNGMKFHKFDEISNLSDAYRVQDAYVAAIIGDDTCAGYKIGLTSKRMQQMCGIDQPICGTIFSSKVFRTGTRLLMSDFGRLGLEFEICVRLGRDLDAREGPFAPEQVGEAIDAVAAAIELVDDRQADYSILDINSLVADNSWNAGVVLGAFTPPPARLDILEGIAYQDGIEIGRGQGADALGHPLVPLAWLASHLAATGRWLRKGDIVMTGSIITTRFPTAPFTYRFDVVGLGSVEVSGS
ncbi:2-keto-4-pentenoate hydratase [Microvirga roseola]|uniref:2-keto-4-pentenoate hydratase n=1 Tax=Microvirga roseola TaxID=2883126 RepID=UPI001E5263BC|nr:fumarylacetoacetate hydrolase family protein [Microvirga roseola]